MKDLSITQEYMLCAMKEKYLVLIQINLSVW